MKTIRWTTAASDQFAAAIERIRIDNPHTARTVAHSVLDRIERLATFPKMGRVGEVPDTRELVCGRYVVVYQHGDEVVEVLHIWHGAQDWR